MTIPALIAPPAAAAAAAVAVAGTVGWVLAGPPPEVTALVPPACPATHVVATGQRAATPDVLVPMPLPQPRGPVSVRLCRYRQDGDRHPAERERVLDPARTAALAGLLNALPGGAVVTPPVSPDECVPGDGPVVLVFRYTEGDPAFVEVVGGPCAIVATSARRERERGDVVRFVTEALADGVR